MPARDYEILFIVKPDLDEEAVGQATKAVEDLIAGFGGTVQKSDGWGRRKLAYEVQHLREGYYVLTDFQFEPERVPELEGQLRISDTVFRYLVTRKPEKVRSTRARRKAARAAAEAATAEAPEAEAAQEVDTEEAEVPQEVDTEGPEAQTEEPETEAEEPETGSDAEENEPVGASEVE